MVRECHKAEPRGSVPQLHLGRGGIVPLPPQSPCASTTPPPTGGVPQLGGGGLRQQQGGGGNSATARLNPPSQRWCSTASRGRGGGDSSYMPPQSPCFSLCLNHSSRGSVPQLQRYTAIPKQHRGRTNNPWPLANYEPVCPSKTHTTLKVSRQKSHVKAFEL